jgi:hypothetical protein
MSISFEAAEAAMRPAVPEPLFRPIPDGETFPLDAFPPSLRDGVLGVHGRTQAPLALCAQSVLAAASLGAAREADVRLHTRQTRPLGVFLLTVAASGERKSSADAIACQPITEWEEARRETWRTETQEHLHKLAAWETIQREAHKRHKKDRDALESALRKIGPAPAAPFSPMALCGGDPTVEGLGVLLRDGWGFAGVFSAEGGLFVGGHAMNQDNKLKSAAALSELWDGSPMRRARRGDGVSILTNRRIALHLMIQPGAAALFLSDRVLADQGLLSRFLVAAPASTMGTRFAAPTPESEEALARYDSAMRRLWSRPIRHRDDEPGALDLRILELSTEAKAGAEAFARLIEGKLTANSELREVSGFANKLAEHATRLAGVFAIAENPDTNEVSGAQMDAGVTLATWYATEALRLFSHGKVSANLQIADQVRQWLSDVWQESHISAPDLMQRGPRSVRDQKSAKEILSVLEGHGHLIKEERQIAIMGQRRTVAWRITRGGEA